MNSMTESRQTDGVTHAKENTSSFGISSVMLFLSLLMVAFNVGKLQIPDL